ncbi:MAG: DNA-processing protein DprA [Vicinamibacterales bacterium]|jgi:DNA processing protein|nr:DNA-protecting protein DprA [Acidobacteriota bacterium]MDP7339804.1 DNA-processing protein DprA [Vicinamibacterales bacterium]MDP7670612.1 DNA-processing protein DprA [Vicinamibacterales bacterium]HJO39105.1 DNA-processing protein DprA [Vicinamibacterales bacterium]
MTLRDTVALALLRGFPGQALPEALRLVTGARPTGSCRSLTQLVVRLGLRLPGGCIRDARERADESLARAEEQGVRPITWTDRAYPPCLAAIADPPPVLWLRGHPDVLNTPSVAIVGSRTASRYARDVAEQLGSDLAGRGVTVVSGLARGVDSAAHRGALDGGRTVAVLGSSVEIVYPPEHADLAEAIAAKGGAVVSEFPPETPPRPAHFPQRNRIISGLLRAVVVVEASDRSGSLITARLALDQGREVMAIPGSVLGGRNRGSHSLLKDGAKVVERADDILEEIGLLGGNTPVRADAPPVPPDALLACLSDGEACDLDDLTERSGLDSAALLARLLDLQLQGFVQRVEGGRFVRVIGKW